ncbi:O-antigen ligase family protein [Geodermatophilus chilensis]|uniref:O-antigen ligase family protein n=1 Tax=Geodermatophilus chilensis TaxID=2035835 RepID=UPI000C25F8EA|nr:O-antigen ligase family protein [Geodermatophilus chilensis]
MRPSPVPAVTFLVAVAATPYPGSYWAVAGLALVVLAQAASVPGPLRVGRAVLLAVGWCGVTVLWSVAPSLTVRHLALLALLTVAAALLPRVLGPLGVLAALATACRVLLVASWALYLLVPAVGRTQEVYQYGTLEGVFVQRNVAAFFYVAATLTFLVRAAAGGARRRDLGWAGLAVATLLATSSGTGLAVLMAAAGVTGALVVASRARTVGRRRLVVAAAILPAVGLALWLPFNLGVVSELFGRDATLTGRSVIWDVVERVVAESPWLGQGSGALWVAGVPVTDHMWAQTGFAFYHAHSAYLDHLVQTGVVGLALVLAVVLLALRRSVRRLVASGDVLAMWPAGTLVCLLFYGIDEQSFASSFGWLLVVLAAALAAPDGAATPEVSSLGRTRLEPSSRAVRLRTQPLGPSGRTAMEVSGVR